MKKVSGKTAASIGTISVSLYVINYFLRNILSTLSPQMLESELFSLTLIGSLSSAYMLFYAIGQLINGFIGDVVAPKRMISLGITLAGLSVLCFPFVSADFLRIALFSLLGFSLSMLRGPLMKVITENTEPNQARLICVFFSCASFIGPLVASLVAVVNRWSLSFIISGSVTILLAVISYFFLQGMEKRGLISFHRGTEISLRGFFSVFKTHKFFFYLLVACLIEIAYATGNLWLPTYFVEALSFDKNTANLLFSIPSIISAFMPFAALAVFRIIGERDIPILRVSFLISAIAFGGILLTHNPFFIVALILVARAAFSFASAMLWSIYIPGLGKTGRVSSINGMIDCTGYAAAALSNLCCTFVVERFGWSGAIVLWSVTGAVGFIAALFQKNVKTEI